MELPANWDDYLKILDRKQRHELKRKMRNLQKAGEVVYRVLEDRQAISESMNLFLQLFPDYRHDKAEFMTSEMQAFFRSLSEALAQMGVMRFGVLELDHKVVAMIMYFDYTEGMYLYNSAYDLEFKSLSVGVINKAMCIQDGIQRGRKKFDFLKGAEQYKYYLGGKEFPLFNYLITIS
jgi:CelD/BcsL family acetyltransferase involved in cellulose biosynthesis